LGGIAAGEMIAALRYVFGAETAMLASNARQQ
jgi:hypothetical protein